MNFLIHSTIGRTFNKLVEVIVGDVSIATSVTEPRVKWKHLSVASTFYDRDGSTWQVQKDPKTGEKIPVKILDSAQPVRSFCGHVQKHFRGSR